MKKSLISAALFVVFGGILVGPGLVYGQAAPRTDVPHRIALIDMAQVFKKYTKFTAMREELKGDLTKSEDQFKRMAQQLQKEQQELKTFKEGTPEYATLEKTIVGHTTQAETYRKTQQRDLIRREAQIYKTIYLEVSDAVQKYASARHYTLVLRFSADELEGSENPEEVMRGLNKQVVYYRPSDDMTNQIITYLNGQYEKVAGVHSDAAPAQR